MAIKIGNNNKFKNTNIIDNSNCTNKNEDNIKGIYIYFVVYAFLLKIIYTVNLLPALLCHRIRSCLQLQEEYHSILLRFQT